MAASGADDLLRELLVMETTLEKVSRRLEEEFAERFQGATVNPLSLARRIQRLQSSLPELRADCQALIQRKQELIDAAKQQLVANHGRLQQLSAHCGLAQQENETEAFQGFKQVLAEWDSQVALQNSELVDQPQGYSRDDLNRALAGSMLAH